MACGVFSFLNADEIRSSGDITITGENITYSHLTQVVMATDNVKLKYKDAVASTNTLSFDVQKSQVFFPQRVTVGDARTTISMDNFSYDFKTLDGHADRLDGKIERLYIQSSNIDFTAKRIKMEDTQFTTCSLEKPHYLLTARKLYLYPQFGFFVAVNNWFTNELIPVPIWVPTYVYGSQKYSILATPLPIVGSNRREGVYIKHKLGYFLNEKSNGTFDFGTSEKLGMLVGFNNNYVVSDRTLINTQVHTTHEEGIEGSLSYIYSLKKSKNTQDVESVFWMHQFSNAKESDRNGQFIFKLGINELIFDSRVDTTPEVSFNKMPFQLGKSQVRGEFFASVANVKENTKDHVNHQDSVVYFAGTLRRPWVFSPTWSMDTSFSHIGYVYGDENPWQRTFAEAALSYRFPLLNPTFSYRKLFFNEGESGFEYQRIYSITHDEFGLSLQNRIGQLETRYDVNYRAQGGQTRSREIRVTYYMHCWSFTGSYESVESRMGFGFSFF